MSRPVLLRRVPFALAALLAIAFVAAGCGGSSGGGGAKIALLLPENETPRYESNDRPDFEKAVEEQCGSCEVLYNNAGGDAEKQQSQAEAALTQGAEVLVVDPMDSKSAAAIAEKAKAQNVPVVSYDRLIENGEIDAYVSFDNLKVGELQAETLAKKLKEDGSPSGPIIMINGDPADPNAALFKEGAHKGFEAAGVKIAKEYDTPGWTAENAQREAQQAITALGNNGFAGIYAANDDTGGGAIAAMKGAGINPAEKPVTGQDATVAGLQRILAGQQYMTVYKEIGPEAKIS
ncbi:MAG TPA: substrate-binding domain-containing protein, partial [Solirubrobacterales bacterium]|nr:substrate-binding domain-containing protein [Solirubrobacterales bacterium]